eukprot:3381596-Prymnesium_polylepis.4
MSMGSSSIVSERPTCGRQVEARSTVRAAAVEAGAQAKEAKLRTTTDCSVFYFRRLRASSTSISISILDARTESFRRKRQNSAPTNEKTAAAQT